MIVRMTVTTPAAAAPPTSKALFTFWYRKKGRLVVAVPGPPLVISLTWSNTLTR